MTKVPWDCEHEWWTLEQVAAFFLTDLQILRNVLYKHPELFPEDKRFADRGGTPRRLLSRQRDVPRLARFFPQYVKQNPSNS
jgi:hypothetical protein